MRGLIIYSRSGGMAELAAAVAEGLRAASFQVELKAADEGTGPISVAPFDVVCVGSPVLGFFGGGYAPDVDVALKRCTRMEGKRAAVFVKPKLFGTTKALRRLMGLLEREGAWVQDFAAVNGRREAERFGRRLEALVKKAP